MLREREDGDAVVCQFCSFSHPLIHESSLNVHEVLCQHDQRRCIPEGNIPDVLNPYLWDNLHTVPSTDANSEDNERQMADPKRRMATFLTWPRENTVSSEHLCAAGFYYTGTDDRVQCFSCGVQSSHWAPSEDPWVRHARSTRCCRHIEAKQGADYYRRVMNEFGPYTEKAAVIRNMTVTNRILRPRMDSLPVQRALDMNIPNKDVTRVVTRRLQNRETDFNNAADIVREVSALNEVVRTDPQVPPVLPTICKSLRNKETTSDMMKAKFNWSCPDLQDCLKVVLGEEHWGEVIEKHTREGPGDLVDLPYLLKLVVSLLKEPNTAEEISVEQLTGRELINRLTCKICLAHKIEVTFQPCGHFVCCSACAAAMTICPLCRQRITGSIKCRICY
ncbi:BIRC3 [Bugula neritina]|uniref:BIRC3 n=1 Tax=Bugula neritina TaxID=10212 RepID=A0A7J7K8R3_BUGNE|nr:BIRC3 [Bugula neritina]